MSEIRLTTTNNIVKNTPMGGNVGTDKYIFIIDDVQVMLLEPVLGTNLYQKIQNDYNTNSLSGLYLTLHQDYIEPFLWRAVFADYSSNGKTRIRNNTNVVHTPDNGRPTERYEDDRITQNYKNKAKHYLDRMERFLCVEGNNIPEYISQINSYDTKASINNGYSFGWYFNDDINSNDYDV